MVLLKCRWLCFQNSPQTNPKCSIHHGGNSLRSESGWPNVRKSPNRSDLVGLLMRSCMDSVFMINVSRRFKVWNGCRCQSTAEVSRYFLTGRMYMYCGGLMSSHLTSPANWVVLQHLYATLPGSSIKLAKFSLWVHPELHNPWQGYQYSLVQVGYSASPSQPGAREGWGKMEATWSPAFKPPAQRIFRLTCRSLSSSIVGGFQKGKICQVIQRFEDAWSESHTVSALWLKMVDSFWHHKKLPFAISEYWCIWRKKKSSLAARHKGLTSPYKPSIVLQCWIQGQRTR